MIGSFSHQPNEKFALVKVHEVAFVQSLSGIICMGSALDFVNVAE